MPNMDDQDVQGASTYIVYDFVKFKRWYTFENHNLFSEEVKVKLLEIPVLMPYTKNQILFDLIVTMENGYISVCLRLESKLVDDVEVITKFKFILLQGNEEICSTREYKTLFDINQRISEDVDIGTLNKLKDFSLNKINISIEGTVYQIVSPLQIIAKANLSKDLGHLFTSQESYDLTFSVAGTKIKAHKIILAARSPVFKAMFSHETYENTHNLVEITDIQPNVLKDLLHFIYTGEALTADTDAIELLAAAEKYQLLDLKLMCEEAICKTISIENVVQNMIFADMYNARKLKEAAINFIKKHGNKIMVTPEWKLMISEYPMLVADVLHSYFTQ